MVKSTSKVVKKVMIIPTLRMLDINDKAEFNLQEVSENSVRSRCSELKKTFGVNFKIERNYPYLIVTRV
jgi:hypothetical protein